MLHAAPKGGSQKQNLKEFLKDQAGEGQKVIVYRLKPQYQNAIPGDEKEALIEVIANNMKKSYNVYNKEHVTDDVIFRHLKELSENRLDLTSIETLEKSKIYYTSNNNRNNNNNKNTNKNQSNNKRRHNNNNHKNRNK